MPIWRSRLLERLNPEIDASPSLREVYETDRSAAGRVLARMEQTGIRIDPVQLKVLSGQLDATIQRLSGGDLRAGRQAVQHQFAAAIWERSCLRI